MMGEALVGVPSMTVAPRWGILVIFLAEPALKARYDRAILPRKPGQNRPLRLLCLFGRGGSAAAIRAAAVGEGSAVRSLDNLLVGSLAQEQRRGEKATADGCKHS
jgi:hypothetical protein